MNIVVGCSIGCATTMPVTTAAVSILRTTSPYRNIWCKSCVSSTRPSLTYGWWWTGMSDFSDWKPGMECGNIQTNEKQSTTRLYIPLRNVRTRQFLYRWRECMDGRPITRNSEKNGWTIWKEISRPSTTMSLFEPIFDEIGDSRFRGYRLDCHRYGDRTSERQSGFPSRMGASHCRLSPNTGRPRVLWKRICCL